MAGRIALVVFALRDRLDACWDEPEYAEAQDTFTTRGAFILGRLRQRRPADLDYVLDNLYRQDVPDPMNITKTEWEIILRYMGADDEEIKDVQLRMGRVWR